MGRLTDKVVIVTGAASGMGAATALLCAQEGAHVLATDVNAGALAQLRCESNGAIDTETLDVRSPDEWARIVAKVIGQHGRLDVLVNNAGIPRTSNEGLAAERAVWANTLEVNLSGPFYGIEAAVPAMRLGGGGSIINIASISGIVGVSKASAYTASKGGLRSLTKGAAIEFASDKIRVNAICPGYIDTPMFAPAADDPQLYAKVVAMTPLGHLGKPRDIAQGVVFLASEESAFVTGIDLVIDGGLTAL